jgi:hypothetical protein
VLGALSGFGICGAGSSRAASPRTRSMARGPTRRRRSSSTIRGPGLQRVLASLDSKSGQLSCRPICIRIEGPTASYSLSFP